MGYFEVEGLPSTALELILWSTLCQDLQAADYVFIVSCAWGWANKLEFSEQLHTQTLLRTCHCGIINQDFSQEYESFWLDCQWDIL
jgi:hypothetical protein